MITERLYTAADLWELSHMPEYDFIRLELSEGYLIKMAPAGGEHGEVAGDAFFYIKAFVKANPLGYVTAAETGYVLHRSDDGKDTVRAPDVGFVSKARLPAGLPKGYIPFAPDLAVEVVSPNDKAAEIQTKIGEYLRYGVRLIWVLYPDNQSIVVHTKEGARTLTVDDTLDGGDVLPGFSLPVRDLFPV